MAEDWQIKPRTSKVKIQEKVGMEDRQALRESQERRDELEKLAIMHTGEPVYVQISGDSAYADIADSDSQFGMTDRVIINVRREIPDQVVTDIDPEVWDRMVQRTDLYHELGHVLYTDWPSFEDVMFGDGNGNFGITEEHHAMFKNWWNLTEDATIERLLIDRFDIEDEIKITNENLIKRDKPDKTVSLHEATSIALLEYVHPVGWIDKLLDENDQTYQFLTLDERKIFEENIYPELEDRIPRIIEESDPEKRNYMRYTLYEQIGLFFDDSVNPGLDEDQSFNLPDDITDSESQTSGNQDPVPDAAPDAVMSGDPLDIDKQQDYNQKIDQQKQNVDPSAKQNSMESWARAIDREYDANNTTMTLNVPSDPPKEGSFNDATKQEALRLSQPLARDLRQRLHHQQRSKKQKKKKTGKVDSTSVHKTKKGQSNIFTKTSDPDEKDYSCLIVTDRSGSMRGEVENAEIATGALAYALEDIGVDVSVLSHLKEGGTTDVHLEKDFSESVDESEKKLFRGVASGGTPLSDALMLAKARFNLNDSAHPFMIVITDGEPDHRERYRDILHQCDFPVLGVYIKDGDDFSEDHMNEAAYFHQLELRTSSDVFEGVKSLTKNTMF